MIDMTGDVDEAGWQYALKFHGADWHGNQLSPICNGKLSYPF